MKPATLLILSLLGSCAFDSEPEESSDSPTRPRLVGRVASIPGTGEFVLIEAYGKWTVPDGGILSGIGDGGRTASLVATGEKLGQFSAADVRSGVAKVGDAVYFRPVKEEGESDSVESPVPAGTPAPLETKTEAVEAPASP
jgi:hypothetical protein